MKNEQDWIEEVRQIFNDICIIHDSEIVRCIGFHVGHDDYYYRVKDIQGKEYLTSGVGSIDSLKDIYPGYIGMENHFTINQCPKEAEYIVTRDELEIDCRHCCGKGKIKIYD